MVQPVLQGVSPRGGLIKNRVAAAQTASGAKYGPLEHTGEEPQQVRACCGLNILGVFRTPRISRPRPKRPAPKFSFEAGFDRDPVADPP